ncbi:hypothetical protein DV735_g3596, partial [Chaetothyriales sp. CBS 134920]
MFSSIERVCAAALVVSSAAGVTIAEINGNQFISPYSGEEVSDVSGLVTAVSSSGFWLRSTSPDSDPSTSESVFVYTGSSGSATVGNIVTLGGTVKEYRSSSSYLYLTEITKPTDITVESEDNDVVPLTLGLASTSPPTEQLSSLDGGSPFNLPANASQVSTANPTLQPDQYGLDFWESLLGELVLVSAPHAVSKPNSYGETYVVGNWTVSSLNSRNGLTLTSTDFNPEAILIGDPLDGTSNPDDIKLGDSLGDITGVVYQQYGSYYILPLTAIEVTSSLSPELPSPASFQSTGDASGITFGQYNVENLAPNSTKIDQRARDIVTYLGSPDLVFLQEIQDDSGPTDDGTVDANKTLDTLTAAIVSAGGPQYSYTYISPVNDEDGGQPGGNIRLAYLYNPSILALYLPNPGSATDAVEVVVRETLIAAGPTLNYNPGLIDPTNAAWESSRKPLVAQWQVLPTSSKSTFFTINVQFTSKSGSSPIEGDLRPQVNKGVEKRNLQANVTAAFAASILAADTDANVLVAGDFNEFDFVEPLVTFQEVSGLQSLDELAGIPEVERYSYLYQQNSQELDHFYVSRAVAGRALKYEHIHVNTWVSYDDQASDHDPAVAQLDVSST